MTLSIIVPHYHEPWSLCKNLFDSIALQRGIRFEDVSVIIVNDGDDVVFPDYICDIYPYKINYIVKEHNGLSSTRNRGLDESDADYVMFCDADDMFLNNLALKIIWMEMEKGKNIINPMFLEEVYNEKTKEMAFVEHKSDATFIHGKAYKRSVLTENNIRFPDGLNLHEDGYFNSLAICCGQDKIVEINMPLYLWRWNKDSTVRKEDDFTVRTYDKLCEAWWRGMQWMKANGYDREYRHVVCKAVVCTYYNFQTRAFTAPENAKQRRNAERAFRKLYMEIRNDFLSCDNKMISRFTEVLREDAIKLRGFFYETITLSDWLKYIEYEVK